jgi:hypothetical protein
MLLAMEGDPAALTTLLEDQRGLATGHNCSRRA